MQSDKLLTMVTRGHESAKLLPILEAETAKLEDIVKRRVFSALEKGELTDREALTSWMELHAMEKLKRKLNQQVKAGQSSGERLDL